MLFVDYSSAFNTIVYSRLVVKLRDDSPPCADGSQLPDQQTTSGTSGPPFVNPPSSSTPEPPRAAC